MSHESDSEDGDEDEDGDGEDCQIGFFLHKLDKFGERHVWAGFL